MSELTWLLPVLIGLPIVSATVPLLLGGRFDGVGWMVTAAVAIAHTVLGVAVLAHVVEAGPVTHALGGFEAPIGIVLVADELSSLLVVLIGVVAIGTVAYTRRGGPRGWPFASVFVLLLGGLTGVVLTGDLFNLFVFLEITGITTYALIAARDSPTAALASLKYLIVGTMGATFYLVGVGLLFATTGTLNMADMAASLAGGGSAQVGPLYTDPLVLTGFGFIFAGLATKIALFPLHSWQPDAYAEAADGVTAFVAALVATSAAYALIRVAVDVFTVDFFAAVPAARWLLIIAGGTSVFAGSLLAVLQSRIKRMLAYSSVAQFGLVVAALGVAVGPEGGYYALLGAVVHLVGHALMKGGLFAGVGTVASATDARTLDEYADLARRRPLTAVAIATLGLALVGVPPSVGFLGKWFIAIGALEADVWIVTALVVATTLLSLGYVARLVERMFVTPDPRPDAMALADGGDRSVGLGMLGAVAGATLVVVGLGVAGGPIEAVLEPFLEGVVAG